MQKASVRKKQSLAALLFVGVLAWLFVGIPWGIFTANFVYLLGMTQGILAIVVFLWLLGVKWAPSYVVPAGIISLSYAPMAIIFVLGLLKGQGEIFHWTQNPMHSSWFTMPSFLFRNLGALFLFYATTCYILVNFLKDRIKKPQGLCFLLLLFVLNQTFIGWDFGMNLSPGWHNTLFAPTYWFGNLYAGLAILMLMVIGTGNKIMERPTWDNMRKLLLSLSIIWVYLWWAQFITIWYANIPEEVGPLYARFSGGFSIPFGLTFLCLFLIPFATIILDRGKGHSLKYTLMIILFGAWLERYLMVIPPIRHLKEETGSFELIWMEGITTAAFFAAFLLLLSFLQNRFKIVPAQGRTR